MRREFNYFFTSSPNNSVLVDNIGNVVLLLNNDAAYEWFLRVNTDHGNTTIKTFGPIRMDFEGEDRFVDNYNFSVVKFPYNEKKIISYIDKYINDPKKIITQVQEISEESFFEELNSIEEEEI